MKTCFPKIGLGKEFSQKSVRRKFSEGFSYTLLIITQKSLKNFNHANLKMRGTAISAHIIPGCQTFWDRYFGIVSSSRNVPLPNPLTL